MLYVVATPIGNLDDMTLRAINVLNNVDLILAEDTRVTARLLERYNIKTKMAVYHEHSTSKQVQNVIDLLRQGKNMALVSDAGTPGVNDPGSYLINQVLQVLPEMKIIPIPGPNAAATALSISGFPSDRYVYLGFPPHKKGRQTFFINLGHADGTVVFYESKHRIRKCLENLRELSQIGARPVMIARELTKQFETVYRGTIDQLMMQVTDKALGEFVVVIGPKERKSRIAVEKGNEE